MSLNLYYMLVGNALQATIAANPSPVVLRTASEKLALVKDAIEWADIAYEQLDGVEWNK